jgi:lipoprotein-anchoring transpeptidase ErfK/SrfK
MPYWQQFHRDMGFHETPSYLYQGPGSHGCLNLLRRDAVTLYGLTKRGTPVQIFGRKPGT